MDPSPAIEQESASLPAYATVALPVPLRRTFQYAIPEHFRDEISPGSRVLVPFGKRRMTGFVVDVSDVPDPDVADKGIRLKEILEVPDASPLINEEILRLTEWTADYYLGSWGELLKAALPAGLSSTVVTYVRATEAADPGHLQEERAETGLLAFLLENGETPVAELKAAFGGRKAARNIAKLIESGLAVKIQKRIAGSIQPRKRKTVRLTGADIHGEISPAQERALLALAAAPDGELPLARLQEIAEVSVSPVNTLEKNGVVEVFAKEFRRDPLSGTGSGFTPKLTLTDAQSGVLHRVTDAIAGDSFRAFLLHGVTGSGKTEVYIRSMRKALEMGKSSLMLVPEIALTPVFSRMLRAVFGEEVAILHSSLSKGERYDEWKRIRDGSASIVIGTRSAVFAPLENLGLVVVDEEHDPSYRQHEMPFYHGRDVAIVRAKFAGAVVVLGSATPAMESYFNAKSGKYELLELPERIGDRPLAQAQIVDLRETFKEEGKDPVIAPELRDAIRETQEKGEQSIILLNKRGYSQFVLCRSCGETVKCRNCDITLTFHKGINRLVCHYCNYRIRTPQTCPQCHSRFLYFLGEGTEQLERLLKTEFPDLRIARIDRDSTRKRRKLEKILQDFSDHKIDMLTGTQMLAKGHDFPNVTLVGVVSVDTGLALPDFRSAERTFQLLTQVAGRAGRGKRPGRVIIQTFHPSHYALLHAKEQSYEAFYEDEIVFRKRLRYPPFTAMTSILVKHADIRHAAETAGLLRKAFAAVDPKRKCSTLGPAPAALSRIKGEFRLQMIVRCGNRSVLRSTLEAALEHAERNGCDMRLVYVEVDPVSLL